MNKLEGKVAIVTGAASGLGKAIAERFAAEGARVVVADIQDDAGQAVAESLTSGYFVNVDVTNPMSVQAMVAATVSRYGKLDILVNNAGIAGEQAPTAESSIDNWRQVIAVNLDGVYFGMKYGISAMLENSNGGAILNMSSIVGLVAFGNIPPYSASKAGVISSHALPRSNMPRSVFESMLSVLPLFAHLCSSSLLKTAPILQKLVNNPRT